MQPDELAGIPGYVVLDDDDRVIYTSPGRHQTTNAYIGQALWARLPEAEEMLRPRFEEARRTGEPVEFTIFYAGSTTSIRAVPAADGLAVHAERLTVLNVRTLATLAESLKKIEAELAARAPEQRDPPARESLPVPL